MHLVAEDVRSLDETEAAVDLGQSPGEIVVLSFSDSDLGAVAAAAAAVPELPSLRLAALGRLKHPYSVDLYLEKTCAGARVIVVRCLGGADYWRYGVDELAVLARARGIALAVVPGDHLPDLRLERASTLPPDDLGRIWTWFQEGGPDNMASLLGFLADKAGRPRPWAPPVPVPAAGPFAAACRDAPAPDAPRALVVFYRSQLLAGDTAPLLALADALQASGFAVATLAVTSLKDPRAIEAVAAEIAARPPAVIVNTTAFSARLDAGASARLDADSASAAAPEAADGTVLDRAGVPVLQAILPTTPRAAWAENRRGLGAADLAMNVVLPELDGRILARAVSFKASEAPVPGLDFAIVRHRPEPDGIAFTADLAAAWARLGAKPPAARRVAIVLSDYPGKGGRTGYAVGLDTAASLAAIVAGLSGAGYRAAGFPPDDHLMAALEGRLAALEGRWGEPEGQNAEPPATPAGPALDLDTYRRLFAALPADFRASVTAAWGDPAEDPAAAGGAFRFRTLGADAVAGTGVVENAGAVVAAVQPDRGRSGARKSDYHDPNLPPCHFYVAFYLWLRHVFRIDALVHLGTHGTLEWLPGKSVALAADCAPAVLAGPVPVIYPFIVNNPGEAAQAKRRIGAVTIGHLTPPLARAGHHGAAAEIEPLLDEYAEAQGLDPRRARRLAAAILDKARETGLAGEAGIGPEIEPREALARLDAWLCDLKDMRIGDGLHVYGRAPAGEPRRSTVALLAEATGATPETVADRLDRSAAAETAALLAALAGRFVAPGPAGAPVRGRLDVLPTGRNLTAVDPRAIPTATAWEIGSRTAAEVMTRHAQEHGEWPRRIFVDLWGSATLRTGGDDLAQAFAYLGVRPVRDPGSSRVSGFEILPPARLDRPRVDVTLRISGLFRDVFPAQIALFDEAARAVAGLDEDDDFNPLAAARRAGEAEAARIFGAAPGAYGSGLSDRIQTEGFADRADLGAAYLSASAFAYGAGHDGVAEPERFRDRVAAADAFVHVEDDGHRDILDSDAFATHEGGFSAAAASLGANPALYHADTTGPGPAKVRTLGEAIARVVRGRAINPRWIAGQMRHGHRGAAEIAETVGNLYAFAATTEAVTSRQFDLVYDATLGDDAVRDFLLAANPAAAHAIARTFASARRRGYWQCRRNAPLALLSELTGDAA
ncbi:cobaltochelatase subunit CobN [Prosthecodimorpha staleyi]|uniref:Cobaltochelatase subunit CobN n=1 Tax=Prosthecodimorpha staleyi TaxID=2840188 RepID=A0A947DBP1_9HYPH|nr:cobaltochelatase subunit CobN [Prosthecodimorpha staleyi]MBT9292827.1 cobaltochelatase subunit CobN [Prosthecodimorpha staleyi]